MDNKETNLFKALGLFIKEMRSVFHAMCLREFGQNWQQNYAETFRFANQKDIWNTNIENNQNPQDLIDFGNLEMFAEHYKESQFFRRKFCNGINFRVPTYFKDIAEARNNLMHFLPFDNDNAQKAYLHMIGIVQTLEMKDLVDELRNLRNDYFGNNNIRSEPKTHRNLTNTQLSDDRLYSNKEIQKKITEKAQTLSDDELNKLCDLAYSRALFNNTYPIFVRVPQNASNEERQEAIKDHNNANRWTVKYEFIKNGYSYFVTTQWYPRNDAYVKKWLDT